MRSRFERGERALCTRLPFDDTQTTRGVNEANTRRKRGGYAVKTREKRVCSVRKTRSCTRAALCIFERVSSGSPRPFARIFYNRACIVGGRRRGSSCKRMRISR